MKRYQSCNFFNKPAWLVSAGVGHHSQLGTISGVSAKYIIPKKVGNGRQWGASTDRC